MLGPDDIQQIQNMIGQNGRSQLSYPLDPVTQQTIRDTLKQWDTTVIYTTLQPNDVPNGNAVRIYFDGVNYFLYTYTAGTWRGLQLSSFSASTIARDAVSSGGGTTLAHTCSGTNRLLVVCIKVDAGGDCVTTVTYAGANMTQMSKQISYSGPASFYLYYILSPTLGTNNVLVSQSSSPTTHLTGASYTGVNQILSFPDGSGTANSASTGTSISVSATSTHTNCWLIGGFSTPVHVATAGAGTSIYAGTGNEGSFDSNGVVTVGSNSLVLNVTATDNAALAVMAVSAVASV